MLPGSSIITRGCRRERVYTAFLLVYEQYHTDFFVSENLSQYIEVKDRRRDFTI